MIEQRWRNLVPDARDVEIFIFSKCGVRHDVVAISKWLMGCSPD
jgi:hypothetical protein